MPTRRSTRGRTDASMAAQEEDIFTGKQPKVAGKARRGRPPKQAPPPTPHIVITKPTAGGVPLVGREQEYKDIQEPLVSSLKSGLGCCLYVSGVPGTGKTATVRTVLKAMVREYEFDWVEVNGMKVASPHDVYSLLYHRLSGRKASPATAIKRLDRHFLGTEGSDHGGKARHCVLVLDEVDALLGGSMSGTRNKHQSVLYRLLEWPTTAPLSIIAIANTMDLPERQLGGRLASRLGMLRVNFSPYTYPQLMRILERRFLGDGAMTADALEYCARKVGAVSGDARRALNLAGKAQAGAFASIGIKEMDTVINGSTVAGRTPGIANLPSDLLLVLLATYNMTSVSPVISTEALLATSYQLSRTAATTLHHTDIQRSILSLLSMGVLVEQQRGGKCVALSAVHRDDVGSVLAGDPLFSRFVVASK